MGDPASKEATSFHKRDRPVIPPERSSRRIAARRSSVADPLHSHNSSATSSLSAKENPRTTITPAISSVEQRKPLTRKSSPSPERRRSGGTARLIKRKAVDEHPEAISSTRRTRNGGKAGSAATPSQREAAPTSPTDTAAESEVKGALESLSLHDQAGEPEPWTRNSEKAPEIHPPGVNNADIATTPRPLVLPTRGVTLAADTTSSATARKSMSLPSTGNTQRIERRIEATSATNDPGALNQGIQASYTPASSLSSSFGDEVGPESTITNSAVPQIEPLNAKSTRDPSVQSTTSLSSVQSTAVRRSSSWTVPQPSVQPLKEPRQDPIMGRPKRSVRPPKRFGVVSDDGDESKDEIIVASRTKSTGNRTALGINVSANLEAIAMKPKEFSLPPEMLPPKKRKSSARHDEDQETGAATSTPKRKRGGQVQNHRQFGTSIVTLKLSSEKLATAISGPQRKSFNVSKPATTKTQPGGLPSPSSTNVSDDADRSGHEELPTTQEILDLSHRLTERVPIPDKQNPQGQPEVWADSRQALCETVPYFKMPQSGCHQNNGHVYAFLYDGVGHCREYMDTDIIIARAGGGMEADAHGQMQQKKDHSMEEAQVQAVLNDIEHQNPVVVICGNKNAGAICKMPHRYCVLGWYKPVAVWSEKTLGKGKKTWTTIKYRLERLNADCGKKSAWYAPPQEVLTESDHATAGPLVRQTCHSCGVESPLVYLNGWMCLNGACTLFWKLYCGDDAPCGQLHYNPAFLLDRTSWENEEEPYSVRPLVPDSGKVVGDNLTKINTRGIVCPKCGRCNPRRLWTGWTCDNPVCDFENFPKHIPVKPAMLHQPWDNVGNGPTLSQNKYARHLGVRVQVSHKLGFKVFTYTFDGIDGKLVHAVSNARINQARGGPDEMFAAMQRQDDPQMNLHLERRPFIGTGSAASLKLKPAVTVDAGADATELPTDMAAEGEEPGKQAVDDRNSKDSEDGDGDFLDEPRAARKRVGRPSAAGTSGPPPTDDGDLMTAFSVNYGMPYKFVAGGSSLPFASAPWPVRACRADLNWASQHFSDPSGHTDFNEQLIFAYMEGQKVEYHDDGESGLGPRIASMSFGSKAKMMLRMKGKHHVGCSKTGVFVAEKPVPGGLGGEVMYQKRLAGWEELQALKRSGDKRAHDQRRKELPQEIGIFEKRTKKAEDLVTITLNHGDIVLMEGYEIQQYLEHKVVPEGCLRFALTCRTVLPEHLKPEERPSYGVEPDEPDMSSLTRIANAAAEALLRAARETEEGK